MHYLSHSQEFRSVHSERLQKLSGIWREITSPAPRDIWQELLQHDTSALISQTPAWLDAICDTTGAEDASRLYETVDGKRLILPLVRAKGLPKKFAPVYSLPHGWGMGGVVSDEPIQKHEAEGIFADLIGADAVRVTLRPNPLLTNVWEAVAPAQVNKKSRLTQIIDIREGFEHYWANTIRSTNRTKVRKAEKSGLVVECDTTGKRIPDFYQLYMKWMNDRAQQRRLPQWLVQRLGRWREPYRRYESVARRCGDACRVWTAHLDGVLVAASISLIHGKQATFWRNASDRELTVKTRANDLLQKCMIEDACNAGCHYYHMGESGGVASLIQFKRGFGAQEFYYHEYMLESLPISRVEEGLHNSFKYIEKLAVSGRNVKQQAAETPEAE